MKFSAHLNVEAAAIIYSFKTALFPLPCKCSFFFFLPCKCSGLTIPLLVPSLLGHFLLGLSSQSGPKGWSQYLKVTVPHLDLKLVCGPTFDSLSLARRVPTEPGHRARPPLCSLLPPTLPSSLCTWAQAASSVWMPEPRHHSQLHPPETVQLTLGLKPTQPGPKPIKTLIGNRREGGRAQPLKK